MNTSPTLPPNTGDTDIENEIAEILGLEKGMSADKMVWFRVDVIEVGPKEYQEHRVNMQDQVAAITKKLTAARIDENTYWVNQYTKGLMACGVKNKLLKLHENRIKALQANKEKLG